MELNDVIIIGCGIIGSAVAFELSKYNLKVTVLEKSNDVANGASKANSAILHGGYDCKTGTKMAELNVKGSQLYKKLCSDLSVERREIPSLVLAFSEVEMETVKELYERGICNKVEGLKILDKNEVLKLEPNINPEISGALYCGSSAIINPWEMCIAFSEVAVTNGVHVELDSEVTQIDQIYEDGKNKNKFSYFKITAGGKEYLTRYLINASGASGTEVYDLYLNGRENPYKAELACGQYYVLDKDQGNLVNSVIFCCPTKKGKGVLVAPTVHGNLIVGPDSYLVDSPDSVGTVGPLLEEIKAKGLRSVPNINFRSIIHEYAGVRPNTNVSDFIIETDKENSHFINLIGMRSPGLSSAPAIALETLDILKENGVNFNLKNKYTTKRERIIFNSLTDEEKDKVIKKDKSYGQIICRCEKITEGEIINAIHRPIVPKSIDAIKRRTNAGMGRCQGGFCSPRVHEILARELNVDPKNILMDEKGTFIITGSVYEN